MPQRWSNATEHADGGNADFERRCLASILRISALYPTKRTNFFCSPGQIRIFQTLLETWLNDAIRDSALHLPNFQLIRSDRDAESTGKSCVGGTCFYINERWCTDATALKKMCCSEFYSKPDVYLILVQ